MARGWADTAEGVPVPPALRREEEQGREGEGRGQRPALSHEENASPTLNQGTLPWLHSQRGQTPASTFLPPPLTFYFLLAPFIFGGFFSPLFFFLITFFY